MESLLARLSVAKQLLEGLRGKAGYHEASKAQCGCLLALLQEAELGHEDALALATCLGEVPWAAELERRVLVAELCNKQHARQRHKKQQNFEALGSYFTAPHWQGLMSRELSFTWKVQTVVDQGGALGLRRPTEPTYAFMASLVLLCCEGPEKARCCSQWHLRDVYLHLKGVVKQRCRGEVLEDIVDLPASVADAQAKFPKTFRAAFATSPPVPCQVPYNDIVALRSRICMRQRRHASDTLAVPVREQQQQQQQLMQAFQSFANMMGMYRPPEAQQPDIKLKMVNTKAPNTTLQPIRSAAESFAYQQLSMDCAPAGSQTRELVGPTIEHGSLACAGEEQSVDERQSVGEKRAAHEKKPVDEKQSVDDATKTILAAMAAKEKKSKKGKGDKENNNFDNGCLDQGAKGKKGKGAKDNDDFDQGCLDKGDKDKKGKGAKDKKAKVVKDSKGKVGAPSWSNERSRCQILYRTGLPGAGQSKPLPYTSKKSEQDAIAQAKHMVQRERKRRGLD